LSVNAKYITDKQDERDGGKTVVILSVIDEYTKAQSRMTIAVFENSGAASDYADWMNKRSEAKP